MNTKEYIDRKRAIVEACNSLELFPSEYAAIEDSLNKIPAADVSPVRNGRWVTHSDRPDSLICSVCSYGFDMWKHDPHNYCPNCGAKMDGGTQNV